MILCAGDNETFKFATPIGVGLVNSAMNFTQLCLFNKPDYVIFIGSAGSYGEYDMFDIIESSSASNIELSFLDDNSYTPLDNVIKTNNNILRDDTIVNSSNYITTSTSLSSKFKQHGIGCENMEFFSLVSIAKEFNIPIAGTFVITNYTNKEARKDFIKNHTKAMDKLIDFLQKRNIIVPHGTLKKERL
ncbi:Purine nucleoside phosphorylase [hydrothermal vent metagenome]|uniref:Purine nucleoside phosphorylase n=1 Tax=hydrothermal vent metagenome TaxID=652676 RepID=A0A3B1E6B4_9ZZZZ